jgi:hypothetical protein
MKQIAALGLTAIALAGCASGSGSNTPTLPPLNKNENSFIAALSKDHIPYAHVTGRVLVSNAQFACKDLKSGQPVTSVAFNLTGVSREPHSYAVAILVDGATFFCPGELPEIERWVTSTSGK